MNKKSEVKASNVRALQAAPRKHFSAGPFIVTVINPSERDCAPSIPQGAPERNLNWRDFRRPLWLTDRCPELAYVPKEVTNCSVLAPFVGSVPRLEQFNGGIRLCRWSMHVWTKTERQLLDICARLLSQVYGIAEAKFPLDSFWPEPSQCGYMKTHSTRQDAEVAMKRSANAFVALAARCSLAIALHSPPDQDSTQCNWIESLIAKDVPPWWIDDFKESHVATFAPHSRVGCYVFPDTGETETHWMNHVPIMARARLPVYIQWPARDRLNHVFHKYPWLRPLYPYSYGDLIYTLRLKGPDWRREYFAWKDLVGIPATAAISDLLPAQSPNPWILDVPEPPTAWISDHHPAEPVEPVDDSPKPPHGPGQRPGESFAEFFARRDRENKEREAKETPDDRLARLARQKQADLQKLPDRNTRVFVWEEMGIYHKNVSDEWAALDYRHLLGGKMRRAKWDEHAPSQRRYDAFRNQWDLCMDLNPDDVPYVDGQSEDDDWDYAHGTAHSAHSHPLPSPGVSDAATSVPATSASQGAVGVRKCSETQPSPFVDLLGLYWEDKQSSFLPTHDASSAIIRYRFGVVTVRQQDSPNIENDCHPDRLRMVLGALPISPTVRLDVNADVMYSFRAWAGGMAIPRTSQTPPCAPEAVWDLHPRNSQYLSSPDRRHPNLRLSIKWLNRHKWYMIDYTDGEPWEWTIIVDNATTALELMRRWTVNSRKGAAKFLAERGMAFRTIMVPDPREVGRLERIPATVLGFRGINAKFDRNDFRAYWSRAHDLLYSRRGRAAVLRGGIVWRIALEMWGSDLLASAIDGPSEDVYDTGEVYRPARGQDYLDDQLTESEIDVICGVYRVLTGANKHQEKHQSWWPRPNVWAASPYNTGFWTQIAEVWFQNRLSKIRAGDAQPCHVQQWKKNLNSAKIAALARESVETVSTDYVIKDLRPAES